MKSVSVIIIREIDDKIFITQRSSEKKFSPGKWETVGGRVEKGESVEEALKREIEEELNVKVKDFKFFKDYYYNKRFFKTFIVKLESKPNPNQDDFQNWGWFSKKEIEKKNFAINCKERILDYYKEKSKQKVKN